MSFFFFGIAHVTKVLFYLVSSSLSDSRRGGVLFATASLSAMSASFPGLSAQATAAAIAFSASHLFSRPSHWLWHHSHYSFLHAVLIRHCCLDRLLLQQHTQPWPLYVLPEASRGSPDSRQYHDNRQPSQQQDVCEHPRATRIAHGTFPRDALYHKLNPSALSIHSSRMRLLSSSTDRPLHQQHPKL